jgi:hypothetical protein
MVEGRIFSEGKGARAAGCLVTSAFVVMMTTIVIMVRITLMT